MKPPRGFESWNPALQGAFRKGYAARMAGEPIEACPYVDRRKVSGRLTWSRGFIRAWQDGWNHADPITEYYSEQSQCGQPPGMPR